MSDLIGWPFEWTTRWHHFFFRSLYSVFRFPTGLLAEIKDSIKGVVITGVDAASVAADKRLAAGSTIVAIEQEQMAAAADVQKKVDALKKAGKKTALLLVATAEGDMLFVALPIE